MPLILIADDPLLLGETDRTFLHRDGFVLRPVGTGEEPLRIAHEQRPDLAVLDAAGEPALETAARFKADPDLHDIPLVLVGPPRRRDAAIAAGAEGFISRPSTVASLLSQVRRFLRTSERGTHRRPVGLKVTCRRGDESFVAFTRDVSATGLFLKSPRPPESGSRLFVQFVLPGERPVPVESEAEVVRVIHPNPSSHATGGAGLRFTSLSAGLRIEIGRFVRSGEDSA